MNVLVPSKLIILARNLLKVSTQAKVLYKCFIWFKYKNVCVKQKNIQQMFGKNLETKIEVIGDNLL